MRTAFKSLERAPYLTAKARRRVERERRRSKRRAGAVVTTEQLPAGLPVRREKWDAPVLWPGATNFSEHAAQLNQVAVVRIAKQCGLLDDFIDVTDDVSPGGGRRRQPGSWALAFLAYVQSGEPNIRPWWRESAAEVWWEAGFAQRPSYDLTYRRFIELEQRCLEDFFDATIPLIRNAKRRSGALVGWDLHLDCTEAESHVRLHHDCREGEGCPGWDMPLSDRHHRSKDPKVRKRAPAGQAKTAGKLSSEEAAASRRARSRAPLREDGTPDLRDDNIDTQYYDLDRDVLRLRVGGHWWTCRDKTAGPRAHTGGPGAVKFWTGFYNAKLACHTFATSIVNLVEGADEYEPNLFEEMLLRAERILGEDHIRSVSADAGFADKRVHMTCAEHGITAITPWKRTASEPEGLPPDREFVDRDGIPRCKHCGGETEFVRFSRWANDQSKNGQQRAKTQGKAKPERVLKPRLWFRCARPFPECRDNRGHARVQSLLVDREPRLLRPLWATTPAYQALRELGLSEERVHHVARARHANGAKDTSSRPQRIGRDWQQLRAHAATILDWLKINWIEGWLTNVEGCIARNPERPYRQNGDDLAAQMAAERRVEGLQRPYGPAAVKAGYGPLRPDRTKRAINPDSGEIIAEGLTARELDALLKDMERGERRLLVVEDDPNANAPPGAHPPPGESPPG